MATFTACYRSGHPAAPPQSLTKTACGTWSNPYMYVEKGRFRSPKYIRYDENGHHKICPC